MIHVACAADAAYLPHAAAMLRSLLSRHPGATTHLLHGAALPAADIGRLRAMCESAGGALCAHTIADAAVAGLAEMDRIPRAMWYRLFLPDLLADVDRVLYLDCDVLVMDDLDPLWATDFGDRLLACVSNVFERGAETRARDLGLASPGQYFNSGVMLLNLRAWRAQDTTREVLRIARSQRLVWPDQDALNLALAGRWLPLHPRWNCQNSLFFLDQARDVFGAPVVREATTHPAILHFEGGELAKPWHYLCKHPRRAEYFRQRAATPWPEVAVEGRTALNRLLRGLPSPWLIAALRLQQRVRGAVQRRLARAR